MLRGKAIVHPADQKQLGVMDLPLTIPSYSCQSLRIGSNREAFPGGIESENDPHAGRDQHGHHDGGQRRLGGPVFHFADRTDVVRPARIPRPPPVMHSSTASIRNCRKMWWLRAPTAMRRPISRVLR